MVHFPHKRQVIWDFHVLFVTSLNKPVSEQKVDRSVIRDIVTLMCCRSHDLSVQDVWLGTDSISQKTFYRKILQRLGAARSVFKSFKFGTTIWACYHLISCLETYNKTSYAILHWSTFIKSDQLDPWIKDQIKTTLLSTIAPLQLPNFVSCERDKPSHMTQNLVTVGTKLWTAERFLVDPWSMDQADLVW